MERRRQRRTRKRIACRLNIGGRQHSGIVLDVSESGLFVQTSASPRLREDVQVVLTLPEDGSKIEFTARIARRKSVPHQLLTVARGGIGLAVSDPPAEFLDFVAKLQPQLRGGDAKR